MTNILSEKKEIYVTIVSANYLGYAKVLADSLLLNSLGGLKVLVVEKETPEINSAIKTSGLDCMYVAALKIKNFDRLAYKFDILELNTALKPSFLKKMFFDGYSRVIYLDPDIKVYGNMDPVRSALDHSEIVLTPHTIKPILDSFRPSDIDFLRSGAYNLGFIALKNGDNSKQFLDWWESRCLGLGFNDPNFGTFVDQKWLDLAQSYFENIFILKDPGCNVAYWNLHERLLKVLDGEIYANEKNLHFFHFSGIEYAKLNSLSKYQTRHSIDAGSVLKALVENYCQDLLSANIKMYENIKYTFSVLDNGIQINQTMRRAIISFPDVDDPFKSDTDFQKLILKNNLIASGNEKILITSKNFDQNSIKVRLMNVVIRILNHVIGLNNLLRIIKYCSILNRENNLSNVLLNKKIDLIHRFKN